MSNESMANYITDTPSDIAELLAEISQLKANLVHVERELEEEKKAVGFYANPSNYTWDEYGLYENTISLRCENIGYTARQRKKNRKKFD